MLLFLKWGQQRTSIFKLLLALCPMNIKGENIVFWDCYENRNSHKEKGTYWVGFPQLFYLCKCSRSSGGLFSCSRFRKLLTNLIHREIRPHASACAEKSTCPPFPFLAPLTSSCGWHLLFLWILAEVAFPKMTLHSPTNHPT